MIHDLTFDYLPGYVRLARAGTSEYRALERFHYLPKRPATWAGVWAAWYHAGATSRLVGVVVLSYPSSTHACRNRVFELHGMSQAQKMHWANAHVRTISRVIVHPQFRSVGIARALVECAVKECPTRYIETSARMGRAHPLFERCGMHRIDPADASKPVYYWLDRHASHTPGPKRQGRPRREAERYVARAEQSERSASRRGLPRHLALRHQDAHRDPSPSPGTPGEGGGEGLIERRVH